MTRPWKPTDEQLAREAEEASRLARNLANNFVRIVLVVPASPEQRYNVYFVDTLGVVRSVKVGLSQLAKPWLLKKAIQNQLGIIARHITEFIPRSRVTPAWVAEIEQAQSEGRRFVEQHPREYRFVSQRDGAIAAHESSEECVKIFLGEGDES